MSVPQPPPPGDLSLEELGAIVRKLQDRVRARHPSTAVAGVPMPDLMPLVHARDAAEAKVAAIGTVNPRPPGLINNLVQAWKRLLARMLDWHVREQVEFNRASVACVQATLDALAESNRSLSHLVAFVERRLSEQQASLESAVSRMEAGEAAAARLEREAAELKDIRSHWAQWREAWEERRNASEIHMLRTISELQAAYQHRLTNSEAALRELSVQQNREFHGSMERMGAEIQQRIWKDLERMREEYDRLIFAELRRIRQRAVVAPEAAAEAAPDPSRRSAAPSGRAPIDIDWGHFAEKFRGSEEEIATRQRRHVERFLAARRHAGGEVVDLGCGRGEFLEAARKAGLEARGIDASADMVAVCRSKGLMADQADLFAYLRACESQSLAAVYCSQVIEHLEPGELPALIRLLREKMQPGALLAIETPNPECLAIFATHFYLDPTHTRPVPPALLAFYLEETGFGAVTIERLYAAAESLPGLNEIPPAFREQFFGAMDYAAYAIRL